MSVNLISAQFLAAIYCIAKLAATGQEPDYQLCAFAYSMPIDELHVDGGNIIDINSDGVPEVYLEAATGWQHGVYYYMDGEVHSVEDMSSWTWSSSLLYTPDEKLIMYTYPHTLGTEGILNYRVWQWGEDGYSLAEDLWRIPTEWGWTGEGDENDSLNQGPVEFEYISSDAAMDPFADDSPYDDLLITQEEFEKKTDGFDKAVMILDAHKDSHLSWGHYWWEQYYEDGEYDYDRAYAAMRQDILEELLKWK